MKEVKRTETRQEESLYEQAMRTAPRFSSNEEAIESYTNQLSAIAKKRGLTVQQLLDVAENSAKFDEDFLRARQIWMTLSALRSK